MISPSLIHLKYSCFLLITMLSACSSSEQVIFEDNFNTPDSYYSELTKNATFKEYGKNSMEKGHLLKKWNYSWIYSFDSVWLQAFYCVPDSANYMEQAGRSASPGNYRIIANAEIPADAKSYEITFRQWKNDNDPVFFLLGTNASGDGGIRFGYENQIPGTDNTVDTLYFRGALGDTIIPGHTHFRNWADHKITVDQVTKEISWFANGKELMKSRVEDFSPGGYFGLSQSYERGTRYDDFKIIASFD